MDKRKAQRKHAQVRIVERGCPFSLQELIDAIQSGRSTPLYKQSNRVRAHRVGDWVAFYDKRRKQVATVLPLEEVEVR